MKISGETWLRAGLVAVGVLLGTGGTLGTQKASTPASPQIIEVKPTCPDIYLDNVKIRRKK